MTLSQGNTGFGYANFILGGVQNVTLAVPVVYRTNKHHLSFFAQDSWKVTRRLTLDYGLRWGGNILIVLTIVQAGINVLRAVHSGDAGAASNPPAAPPI